MFLPPRPRLTAPFQEWNWRNNSLMIEFLRRVGPREQTTEHNGIVVESESVYEYFYRWRVVEEETRRTEKGRVCNKYEKSSQSVNHKHCACIFLAALEFTLFELLFYPETTHESSHSAPIISNIYFQFRVYQSRHNRLILISPKMMTLWHAYLPTYVVRTHLHTTSETPEGVVGGIDSCSLLLLLSIDDARDFLRRTRRRRRKEGEEGIFFSA